MKILFVILFFYGKLLFAVDISSETSNNLNIKKDKSISIKKSDENRESKSIKNGSEKRTQTNNDVEFDTTTIFISLSNNCIRNPKSLVDFGFNLNAENYLKESEDEFVINLTKKEFIESASILNADVKIANIDEEKLKEHIDCIVLAGGKIAQANLNLEQGINSNNKQDVQNMAETIFKNTKIKNQMIKQQIKLTRESLKEECKFFNEMFKIKCGNIIYDFKEQTISLSNKILYSANSLFGINTKFNISTSNSDYTSNENSQDISKSKVNDTSLTKTKSNDSSSSTKDEFSIGKFLPSLN